MLHNLSLLLIIATGVIMSSCHATEEAPSSITLNADNVTAYTSSCNKVRTITLMLRNGYEVCATRHHINGESTYTASLTTVNDIAQSSDCDDGFQVINTGVGRTIPLDSPRRVFCISRRLLSEQQFAADQPEYCSVLSCWHLKNCSRHCENHVDESQNAKPHRCHGRHREPNV